jgi:hypothetical protein
MGPNTESHFQKQTTLTTQLTLPSLAKHTEKTARHHHECTVSVCRQKNKVR